MKGMCIKFYVEEKRKHNGTPLYDWMLKKAKEIGINGGSVFKTIASFKKYGSIEEEHFFEMASNLSVEIVFVVKEEEKTLLFDALKKEKLALFYVKTAVDYGVIKPN